MVKGREAQRVFKLRHLFAFPSLCHVACRHVAKKGRPQSSTLLATEQLGLAAHMSVTPSGGAAYSHTLRKLFVEAVAFQLGDDSGELVEHGRLDQAMPRLSAALLSPDGVVEAWRLRLAICLARICGEAGQGDVVELLFAPLVNDALARRLICSSRSLGGYVVRALLVLARHGCKQCKRKREVLRAAMRAVRLTEEENQRRLPHLADDVTRRIAHARRHEIVKIWEFVGEM